MDVKDIPQIPNYGIELLEAIGCLHTRSLSAKNAASLLEGITKANELLKLTTEEISLKDVDQWIAQACKIEGLEHSEEASVDVETEVADDVAAEVAGTAEIIDAEQDPDIIKHLEQAPEAERLRGKLILDAKLSVSDIPEGIVLNSCEATTPFRTQLGAFSCDDAAIPEKADHSEEAEGFNDFDSFMAGKSSVAPLERGKGSEATSVGEGLNKNVSPNSRRYIKGVLHPNPAGLKLASLGFIFFNVAFTVSLLAIVGALLFGAYIEEYKWKIVWSAAGLLVVSLMIYFMSSARSGCRICGQKQFAAKRCMKHKKAHQIPILGHMLPTAIQIVLFDWFYCIFCGTAVRLKK